MTAQSVVTVTLTTGLSILLGLAGIGKLRRPAPAVTALRAAGLPAPRLLVRVLAAGELALAAAALALPGRVGGGLLAIVFAGLAIGAAIAARGGSTVACGCFGAADGAPLGRRHVTIDLLAAAAGLLAVLVAPGSLFSAPGLLAVAILAAGALLAIALRSVLQGASRPRAPRLASRLSAVGMVEACARALERGLPRGGGPEHGRGLTRRSALVRLAVAGSALSTAPLRYLLYPGTALGVVVPGSCGGGLCDDGYTAFCCEINQGVNACPADTFVGGWWLCTDYRGHQLCAGSGVRYYIDCNAIPGHPFPGGCRCAADNCDHRRVNCNVFRYGQCNTQVHGVTPVVCRVITCESPADIEHLHCSSALMVDDAVCGHEAPCLEPPPVQLAGAGGA